MQLVRQEENLTKERTERSGEGGGKAAMDIRDYSPPHDGFAGGELDSITFAD